MLKTGQLKNDGKDLLMQLQCQDAAMSKRQLLLRAKNGQPPPPPQRRQGSARFNAERCSCEGPTELPTPPFPRN